MPSHSRGFTRFAEWVARSTGHAVAFFLALATILAWAVTGPLFSFSDTWQLAINTGTTIVTFLMVFLIQNEQTRGTEAIQIKLDELLFSHKSARNALLDLEELSPKELERIKERYERVARRARHGGTPRRRMKKR